MNRGISVASAISTKGAQADGSGQCASGKRMRYPKNGAWVLLEIGALCGRFEKRPEMRNGVEGWGSAGSLISCQPSRLSSLFMRSNAARMRPLAAAAADSENGGSWLVGTPDQLASCRTLATYWQPQLFNYMLRVTRYDAQNFSLVRAYRTSG